MGRYFKSNHRLSGLGNYGGLGSDAQKENLKLAKAITNNQLTAAEVNKVRNIWAKWDSDFKSLTTGKKAKPESEAIKIIGERQTIEQIVGHSLVTPVTPTITTPISPITASESSSGPSTGLIIGGIAALAGAFLFLRK